MYTYIFHTYAVYGTKNGGHDKNQFLLDIFLEVCKLGVIRQRNRPGQKKIDYINASNVEGSNFPRTEYRCGIEMR